MSKFSREQIPFFIIDIPFHLILWRLWFVIYLLILLLKCIDLPDGAGSIGAGSQVSISWASISISKRSLSTPSLVGEGQSNAQVVNSGSLKNNHQCFKNISCFKHGDSKLLWYVYIHNLVNFTDDDCYNMTSRAVVRRLGLAAERATERMAGLASSRASFSSSGLARVRAISRFFSVD